MSKFLDQILCVLHGSGSRFLTTFAHCSLCVFPSNGTTITPWNGSRVVQGVRRQTDQEGQRRGRQSLRGRRDQSVGDRNASKGWRAGLLLLLQRGFLSVFVDSAKVAKPRISTFAVRSLDFKYCNPLVYKFRQITFCFAPGLQSDLRRSTTS